MWLRNLNQLSTESDCSQSAGTQKRERMEEEDAASENQGPERGAINSQGEATHCCQRGYASHAC